MLTVVGEELTEFSADCRAGVGEELASQIEWFGCDRVVAGPEVGLDGRRLVGGPVGIGQLGAARWARAWASRDDSAAASWIPRYTPQRGR